MIGLALPQARDFPDPVPAGVADALPLRADALDGAPPSRATPEEAELGRRRLAFEELLVLQVGLARRRRGRERDEAPALGEPGEPDRALPRACSRSS